jgi:hypothetical protein
MVSKNQQILAIVLIIIVILAGMLIVLLNQQPKTPAAGAMILKANDLQNSGLGFWGQASYNEPRRIPNSTSEAFSIANNGSYEVTVGIIVFSNDEDCHALLTYDHPSSSSSVYPIIGDESNWANSTLSVGLRFRVGRTFAAISIQYPTDANLPTGDLIHIAELQLEKIDQYMAQHPGAS